jgi:hypothetical protein
LLALVREAAQGSSGEWNGNYQKKVDFRRKSPFEALQVISADGEK